MTSASQDSRNIAVLVWIGTLFLWFVPGLVVYLIKRDDAYVLEQGKEALNWAITATIGYFAGYILALVFLGWLVYVAVSISHLAFCVLGAMAASNGQPYRVPLSLRLIK
jgi:uncharacterized Tic20 family protein